MTSRPWSILVIDDSPMFRELESLFLARCGRVLTAGGGVEGLDRVRRQRPDVVVVDLDMPDLGGDAVCREIQADPDLSATHVIVVTSRELPEERARAVAAGADDVLSKPINRIALIQAVSARARRVHAVRKIPDRGGPRRDRGHLGGSFPSTRRARGRGDSPLLG